MADELRREAPAFFLPDFCANRVVLAIVLIVELVAIVLTIARQSLLGHFWIDLAVCSLFLLWIGLGCAAVLCRARPWLATLPIPRAVAFALAMPVAVVGIVSEVVYHVGKLWSGGLGDSDVFPVDHAGFLIRNVAVGFIVSALALRYFYVSTEWKRSIEMEALARIRALQARIRPHFLFNCMNTIAALTRSNPVQAEQAIEDLADLFRASLSDAHTQIPLKDEIEIARTHQRIEQLRLGDRLRVEWNIDALPARAQVPCLIIQPLLENAVYHGIEMLPAGGTVHISGRLVQDRIEIEVRNPVSDQQGYGERDGNRMALENIRQRLELAWPGRANVETASSNGEFRAKLTFPLTESSAREP